MDEETVGVLGRHQRILYFLKVWRELFTFSFWSLWTLQLIHFLSFCHFY